MIALVDVNNFYVSCERVFDRRILNTPVVVLSNNDGCIISRSAEVKKIGIKMGTPLFQVKSIIHKHKIRVYSSNYPLYADMSDRVMQLLAKFCQDQEIYSIDECFIRLERNNYLEHGQFIRAKILQDIGLPVCVGIGKTKTLAKLANHIAKKYPIFSGVVSFSESDSQILNNLMETISVGELWGIGSKLSRRLNALNIYSVSQLKNKNPKWIKQCFNINIERMVYELNGICCYPVDSVKPTQKQIICSRSFGQKIENFKDMADAITTFVQRALIKMRKQNLRCKKMTIFIKSNQFTKKKPIQYAIHLKSPNYTNDHQKIMRLAMQGLCKIYKDNISYNKAGVVFMDLMHSGQISHDHEACMSNPNLTNALDAIRNKYHKNIIVTGWQSKNAKWHMKQLNKSRRYTTSWNELLEVS